MKNHYFIFILLLVGCFSSKAKVTIASIFSDNMVLQRNTKIPIWGWASPNEKITVQFHNQTKSTLTDNAGKWMLHLDNEKEGGPYILKVKGENKIVLKNILVGEVWLCSGQSNMEWTVGQSEKATIEIANASLYSNIRHIKIPKTINSIPNSDLKKTNWEICSSKTIANFTGIGYFYAKELSQKLNVPIGLINASWGGTNIETWISREGFENNEAFKELIAEMPKINLDSLLHLKMKTAESRIEQLQNAKFTTQNVPFYKEQTFDDSNWLELQQPTIWEEQILGNFDGVVWLRKHFYLTKEQTNHSVLLQIPAIDDNDITYVNGIKIGETKGWDILRKYEIPRSILKEGDNVIAIQVVDNGGGGGIHGKPELLKLIVGTNEIALNGTWKFQVESIKNGINENEFPSLCYNTMIEPLLPFAIKGVLWYQGESNASRAFQYQTTFPLLINDWRTKFNTDFPFYFVQLATFNTKGNSNEGCSWAELREAQTQTTSLKNTAMVVTTDIGNPKDIHPKNKETVGQRLAAIAFNNLYNIPMICSGPNFQSFEVKNNQIIVSFDSIGTGLMANNTTVNGFEIAGENQVFYPAKAFLQENKVVVFSDEVIHPIAVRFAWIGDASACNLFNKEGFPAVPFRTDDWKTITKDIKYLIKLQ